MAQGPVNCPKIRGFKQYNVKYTCHCVINWSLIRTNIMSGKTKSQYTTLGVE